MNHGRFANFILNAGYFLAWSSGSDL